MSVAEYALCPLNQRLARKLIALASTHPRGTVEYTREELARMVGTTREPASRILAEFREAGLIWYQPRGRQVLIQDMQGLQAVASP